MRAGTAFFRLRGCFGGASAAASRLGCRFAILLATVLSAMPHISFAQSYPARPVRIIVPFSTGTAADIVAREKRAVVAIAHGAD